MEIVELIKLLPREGLSAIGSVMVIFFMLIWASNSKKVPWFRIVVGNDAGKTHDRTAVMDEKLDRIGSDIGELKVQTAKAMERISDHGERLATIEGHLLLRRSTDRIREVG